MELFGRTKVQYMMGATAPFLPFLSGRLLTPPAQPSAASPLYATRQQLNCPIAEVRAVSTTVFQLHLVLDIRPGSMSPAGLDQLALLI